VAPPAEVNGWKSPFAMLYADPTTRFALFTPVARLPSNGWPENPFPVRIATAAGVFPVAMNARSETAKSGVLSRLALVENPATVPVLFTALPWLLVVPASVPSDVNVCVWVLYRYACWAAPTVEYPVMNCPFGLTPSAWLGPVAPVRPVTRYAGAICAGAGPAANPRAARAATRANPWVRFQSMRFLR